MPRLRLSIIALVICFLVQPASVQAQPPGRNMVTFNFTIPITIKSLHPDIISVKGWCAVHSDEAPVRDDYPPTSNPVLVSTLAQNGGTGTVAVSLKVGVPPNAGGKAGKYLCTLFGQTATESTGLWPPATDDRFKTIPTAPYRVEGTFTF
jgi:hypothetical protein